MKKITLLLAALLLTVLGGTKAWADEPITEGSALYVMRTGNGDQNTYLSYAGGSFSISSKTYDLNSVFQFTYVSDKEVNGTTYPQYTISAYNADNAYVHWINASSSNYLAGTLGYTSLGEHYWVSAPAGRTQRAGNYLLSYVSGDEYFPINVNVTTISTWGGSSVDDYKSINTTIDDNTWNLTEVYIYDLVNEGVNGGVATVTFNGATLANDAEVVAPVATDASAFELSNVPEGYTATVDVNKEAKTVTVNYVLDMTNAPVQNGLYTILSRKSDKTYGSFYLQYNSEYGDFLAFGNKTTENATNCYIEVQCVEKSGSDYYYTLKVAGKYAYFIGPGHDDESVGLHIDATAETNKWKIQKGTEGGCKIIPDYLYIEGTSSWEQSMNPWYEGSTPTYKVGLWNASNGVSETWIFSPVYPVTLNGVDKLEDGNNAVATFSAEGNNTVLPEGVKAYYAATQNGDYVTLTDATEANDTLAANEGFFLTAPVAGTFHVETVMPHTAPTITGNLLKPTTGSAIAETTSSNAYILNGSTGTPMFYLLDSKDRVVAKNKAYLELPNGASAVKLVFGGNATDIESVETVEAADNAPIYDLSGRKVLAPQKGGIYVKGGKKIIVK